MFETPEVLRREHRHLHEQLTAAGTVAGPLGTAARWLQSLLQEHAQREEETAFRLLALLPHLADGTVGEEMEMALPIADRLRAELPRLRREHVAMVEALQGLAEAAHREERADVARLAYELLEHARFEEAILYPAALITGDYVRLRLQDVVGAAPGTNRGEARRGGRQS
jgi:hypothetical protein